MPSQTRRGTVSAANSAQAAADALIAANAEVGAWCFKLNGHGGLVFAEQADFFHKGELAQHLLERLRERYSTVLSMAASAATRSRVIELTAKLDQALVLLKALFETLRPKTAPIHEALIAAAAVLDGLDDLCDSLTG